MSKDKDTLVSWKFIEGKYVEEALGSPPRIGKHQLEPLSSASKEAGVSCNILEDHQFFTSSPEVHRHQTDLWIGIEGELQFIVGGEMVEPRVADGDSNEIKAEEIRGGTKVAVRAYDILLIPAGVPHAHTAAHGRAYIIKFPERDIVPFEKVPGWK